MKCPRDPMLEMQFSAARNLPKPPGFIVPGWFWEEWVLLLGCGAVLAILCAVPFFLF
jgi:hypothetical protein